MGRDNKLDAIVFPTGEWGIRDARPLLEEDLTYCAACGAPSTRWADGPGGRAVGCCGEPACVAALALTPEVREVTDG